MRALFIGEKSGIGKAVKECLDRARFSLKEDDSLPGALRRAKEEEWDIIIFNVGSLAEGISAIVGLRAATSAPIILLSDIRDPAGRAELLDLGADDHITKPFAGIELAARARALLRRGTGPSRTELKVGDLMMDVRSGAAFRGGRFLRLGPKETALLEYLMRNAGKVLSRREIFSHAWDGESMPAANTVDVHMSFLRAKVDRGRKKKLIKTVYGRGYMMGG